MRTVGIAALVIAVGCGQVKSSDDINDRADAAVSADATTDASADALVAPDAALRGCDRDDPTLVACYGFEPSDQPTVLRDGSGAVNNGVIGGVTFAAGVVGLAASLTPNASRIAIPEAPSLDITNVTLSAWVRPNAVVADGARQVIIDNDGQWVMTMGPANHITCSVRDSQGALVTVATTVPVAIARWTHLACTYGNNPALLIVYFDGTAVTQIAHGGAPAVNAGMNGTMLGANSPCAQAPCVDGIDAMLDEVRIWNRALERVELCSIAGLDCR